MSENSIISINKLRKQSEGEIVSIDEGELHTKLLEMGFFVGKVVKMHGPAPLGDPLIVEVSNYRLMLRKQEASWIKVKPIF